MADNRPPAGSELAEDDKTKPAVAPIASYGIITAIDHLVSVVDAMLDAHERGRPMRHYAHFTTLRTTLLASTRMRWLLEPDSREQRQLRCVQIEYQNLDEQRKALRAFGAHVDDDQERARLNEIAGMDAEEVTLAARATALGADGLNKPPDMVTMLREQVDLSREFGPWFEHLWRTGSAAAHGYHWPDLFRADPGAFDEEMFNPALYAAVLQLQEALRLYDMRAAPPG